MQESYGHVEGFHWYKWVWNNYMSNNNSKDEFIPKEIGSGAYEFKWKWNECDNWGMDYNGNVNVNYIGGNDNNNNHDMIIWYMFWSY